MLKIKIIPRGKYVLVKPESDEPRESEHGLLVPSDVEQEKKARGLVIDVGKEIKDIIRGDKVVYGAYSGETLKILENSVKVEYKLLHTDDIIAFIK